ncbi:MAG: DUF3987 domain-containing protein [Bacteroidaceae bacterium]|nr:DUF3987 domain-containing protein [Bacteroidaceae bacterium]
MLEESARGGGYHLVFRRRPELTQEENLKWASDLLEVAYDAQAKDITRVFFTTTEAELIYLDDEIFELTIATETLAHSQPAHSRPATVANVGFAPLCGAGATFSGSSEDPSRPKGEEKGEVMGEVKEAVNESSGNESPSLGEGIGVGQFPTLYHGIPFSTIIKKYWEVNNRGFEPTQGDRDTLTYQLACDLRHICGRNFEWLDQVIPCYDGFPIEEKRAKIRSALSSEFNGFPQRLRNTLSACASSMDNGPLGPKGRLTPQEWKMDNVGNETVEEDEEQLSIVNSPLSIKRMPQGIRESIDAVGPQLAMPVVTAICPCIGALATGVKLDVHGQQKGLNLIAYIAGDFASGKGKIDPVIEAWMSEVQALDDMYTKQEDEWRAKKLAAKNKKEQPEEPLLPIRNLTLNNTVANLAQQLANTEGKHAFSFTPEADTVAQKWKSTMSDFSVMLRQSYDGSKYERRAKSVDAVNVHIKHLLWNVTMCGTPDALYRVVNNYTDGFQSRIAVARTPDNTFARLEDSLFVLTDRQCERIQQVAHLLPLMYGEVVLPKLEAKGREWLERIRLETMMNDDRTKARQRFRVCVTAQRMTCSIMLCKVCEVLLQKHGLNGAEAQLKQHPNLWKELLLKAQTPAMLEAFDVIADSLMDNALYFFRDRIENAFMSRDYVGGLNGERQKRGKNDSIFERLDIQFSFEQAMQHSVAVKGVNVNHNTVRQMLKNWRNQKLVVLEEDGNYRKL